MKQALLLVMAAALAGMAAAAPAPRAAFAVPPALTRAGAGWKVAFALAAPTDVEIAVLDATNRVVRHLAAGVLGGPHPPPPPLQAGLAQELFWDGRDDAGAPCLTAAPGAGRPAAPFSVRVRAGMSVRFGRLVGGSPYTGRLNGFDMVATDADGKLYVKKGSLVRKSATWELTCFDREGKYQKTLLPHAPSTPPDQAAGCGHIDGGDGLLTPANRSALTPVFLDFDGSLHRKPLNGALVFLEQRKSSLVMTCFKLDGPHALRRVEAPLATANYLSPRLAFSPDGKYAYYSNVARPPTRTNKPADIDPRWPQGRVYRHDLTKPGAAPEKFYDLELPDWERTRHWLPNAWNKKSAAGGIDVDAEGNLYICDLVNQEVVRVSPDGRKLAAVKAPCPDQVLVGGKSGALYVVSAPISEAGVGYGRPPSRLLKLDGRGAEARVVAELPLRGALGQSVALDESGAIPTLWVGGGEELVRVEDRGAVLAFCGPGLLNSDPAALNAVVYGDVDVEADRVYVTGVGSRVWRCDGAGGAATLMPFKAVDLAVGPGGLIYAWGSGGYSGPVTRYGPDGQPAPLAATGSHVYGPKKSPEYNLHGRLGWGLSVPGLDVDLRGRVYASHGVNAACVQLFDAAGQLVDFPRKTVHFGRALLPPPGKPALIAGLQDQSGSIRVDMAGNVYVLQLGLPPGHVPPRGFEREESYLKALGTIHKFGPEGGEFERFQPKSGVLRSYSTPCGAVSGRWGSTGSVCHCTKPRFDVDGYGRLYIPNAFTYKVAVIDNADNPILDFGGYGNWDAQGPRSAEPRPEIPLGWPLFAGASDARIYVGDVLNHRLVLVDKAWAAEALCSVE